MTKNRREFIKTAIYSSAGLVALGCTESAAPQQEEMTPDKFFIGTSTEGDSQGIYLASLDRTNGALTIDGLVAETENPNFIALHPTLDKLYTVGESEGKDGLVKAFDSSEMSSLRATSEGPSDTGGLCHVNVSPNGKIVAVADYGQGKVSILGLTDEGEIDPTRLHMVQHEGQGPSESRQKSPHAHCVIFSPDSRFLYSADLGIDKVMIYKIDYDNHKLLPADQAFVSVEPGAGPRHFKIHPRGRYAFVICELNSSLTSFDYDSSSGALTIIESVSTLSAEFNGESYCADLHISSDGNFVYGSNRGDNSIAVFSFSNGKLELLQTISTGGNWPRNFALSPSEDYLIVGNRRSNDMAVFSRDSETGLLSKAGDMIAQASPICMLFQSEA